jgi:hypothetical protein
MEVGPPGRIISRAILVMTMFSFVSAFDLTAYIPGTVTIVSTPLAIASEA